MFNKQTTLDLGGPQLGFTTDPQNLTVNTGTGATFVAIGTATFPTDIPAQFATNTGIVTQRWYVDGAKVFDDDVFSGTGTTTLQIANNTVGRTVFCEIDYIPSAYGLPGVAVTVGSARSTGNAINEPLRSASATLNVTGDLSIVTQPQDVTFAVGTAVTIGVNAALTDGSTEGFGYQWSINDTDLTDGTNNYGGANLTISGSNSNVLSITANTINSETSLTSKVVVSNSNASNSPVTSNTVDITITQPRAIINIEQINNTSTAILSTHNLTDGEITFTDETHPSNQICIYSPERDIDIEMELFGGKGENYTDDTGAVGGEGGKSLIRFTLEQNVEYIITGLYDEVNAPFVYRKASLIAVAGEGGDAGRLQDGGLGGGVNVSGNDGGGHINGGNGGVRVAIGEMPANGIYGGLTDNIPYAEDLKVANIYTGGRTIKCTKGIYWRDQGFSACQDIPSDNKFRLSDGTEVQNTSSSITRGFKAGYNMIETKSDAIGEGNGGSGATGGDGATNVDDGGGGGSGYSDGTATIVSTQEGGSTGPAKVIIRSASDLEEVTFTIETNTLQSNTITYELESGNGPDLITFGPLDTNVVVFMGPETVYKLKEVLVNGNPNVGVLRVTFQGTLELNDGSDLESYDDMRVTPSRGVFSGTNRYEFR